ncbi:hypothetical protein GCM10018791_31230 [Streptomyces zaomyceticus]|nr:hypothetical protein GCM10018791_31230 [Streptomyces zaomyceticus]
MSVSRGCGAERETGPLGRGIGRRPRPAGQRPEALVPRRAAPGKDPHSQGSTPGTPTHAGQEHGSTGVSPGTVEEAPVLRGGASLGGFSAGGRAAPEPGDG